MSHPVGLAVLPLGRPGRTTASCPVLSGALGRPDMEPYQAPVPLGALTTIKEISQLGEGYGYMGRGNRTKRVPSPAAVELIPHKKGGTENGGKGEVEKTACKTDDRIDEFR